RRLARRGGGRGRRAAPRGRAAGPHLQPGAWRAAGHRSRAAAGASGLRPREHRPPERASGRGGGMHSQEAVGVLVMSYGSPRTPQDVPQYLTNVYGGRTPDAAVVQEFQRRYTVIGGSPLVAITQAQAAALQQELRRRYPHGPRFSAEIGMRFAPPS